MGKYRDHQELGANAPVNWRENTTEQAYLRGMDGIAPAGMRPRRERGTRFEARTDKPGSARWHRNYDVAMFGGTEVFLPTSETKQAALEGLLKNGIERIPQAKGR